MKKIITIFTLLTTVAAYANGPWEVKFQNQKLPSQVLMEHESWASPIVGTSNTLLSAGSATIGSATSFSSFLAQPDYPRNITILPQGSTGAVSSGTAVVTGTNIFGKTITENFSIANGQSSSSVGTKAFKTVTSVSFPAVNGSSVTVYVGVGNKLGISRCMERAGDYVFSVFDSAYETSRGTMSVSSTSVESNTFQPNGSMDGSKRVDLYYLQNFRCYGN